MAVQQADVMIVQAKQAKSKNDVVRARSLLSQVIKTDPRNEEAWLLFADVAEKKEHAIYSLEQVLKLNPVNMEALDRLNALKAPPPAPVVPTSIPSPQSTIERVATTVPRAAAHETVILDERMHGAMFILPFLMALVGIVLHWFAGGIWHGFDCRHRLSGIHARCLARIGAHHGALFHRSLNIDEQTYCYQARSAQPAKL
jgi:hypothetical protein